MVLRLADRGFGNVGNERNSIKSKQQNRIVEANDIEVNAHDTRMRNRAVLFRQLR